MKVAVVFAALAASVSAAATLQRREGCDIGACMTSNEDVITTCIPAVLSGFSDIISDIKCLTDVVEAFKNPTAECQVCFDEITAVFNGIAQKKKL